MSALVALGEDGLRLDASLAPILSSAVGHDVAFRLMERAGDYAAAARLAATQPDDETIVARFDAFIWLDDQTAYWPRGSDEPAIGVVGDAAFEALVHLKSVAALLAADEAGARFVGIDDEAETVETFVVIADTVLREASFRCAATGVALSRAPEGPQVFVLRPRAVGGLAHVNNCLVLSPPAFAAFEQGHLAARDDFGLLADLRLIDPGLLETLHPSGRLIVSENTALQPSAENLGYHRRQVFGLG